MSTEHEIGVSSWLAFASSVILEEPGSPRYFSFNGFCTALRSMLLLDRPRKRTQCTLRPPPRQGTHAPTLRFCMCGACVTLLYMAKMIQIRNVPDDLHRRLKVRAAQEGMTLSDYLLSEVERVAAKPTMREWLAKVSRDEPVEVDEPPEVTI